MSVRKCDYFNDEQWRKARLLHEDYKLNYVQIAKRFGVSSAAIRLGLKRGEGLRSSS